MKEVHIECAGAGKTYGIAKRAIDIFENCPGEKKIYIVTYTNYAVAQIKTEIKKQNYEIPHNIIIDTIHGFLLNLIVYPFSNYIKGCPINTCSIEKLSNNISFKNSRIKQLKLKGVIHSSEVTKYAKSIIVKLTSDKNKDKAKKDIILDYIKSDIFCLFVDESQDMNQDFFVLIKPILEKIDNYYFVGDPNQAIIGSDCYKMFALNLIENADAELIENFTSRRVPQILVPLCNKILSSDSQISSSSSVQGEVVYVLLSELLDEEKLSLSKLSRFTYIKEKTETFSTGHAKPYLPHEIGDILYQNFPHYDNDAIKQVAKSHIVKYGINKFFGNFGIAYDSKLYAILAFQFNSNDNKSIPVDSIHKVKGLENDSAYFIICKSLIEILIGEKNNHDRETNLLYVAITRSKDRLLFIIDDNSSMNNDFSKRGIDINNTLAELGILRADKSQWL